MTHEEQLIAALAEVIAAEQAESISKTELDTVTESFRQRILDAQHRQTQAWSIISGLMNETGEYEVILPGSGGTDYKIARQTGRESVKVIDPSAVPDEFCKFERKPKLKEIGDYIRTLDAPPNWAAIERAAESLNYRPIKKGSK